MKNKTNIELSTLEVASAKTDQLKCDESLYSIVWKIDDGGISCSGVLVKNGEIKCSVNKSK